MTPTHKERLLADILAALLRIEALMQREKVADSEVDYWVRELSQPKPMPLPGMPDPPIAPVRPQTTWQQHTSYVGDAPQTTWTTPPAGYAHGGWIHATGFSMVGP